MADRRRLLVAVAWLAVLAASWALYQHEDSLQHFAWHLGYGGAAGLIAAAGWTLWQGPIGWGRTLWPLGGYLYMAIPDVLWLVPTFWGAPPFPHESWMDVFLGHYSLDLWNLATPMLIPAVLAAVGVYLVVDRASRERASAGGSGPGQSG